MKTLNCIVAILAFAFVSFGSVVPVDAQWFVDSSAATGYAAIRASGSGVGFSIGCSAERTTTVLLLLNDGIARDGTFQYRVDYPVSGFRDAAWDDGNSVISIEGRRAVAFLREIRGALELRVRIPRFRQGSLDATFNLAGMLTHLSEVRRRCGW